MMGGRSSKQQAASSKHGSRKSQLLLTAYRLPLTACASRGYVALMAVLIVGAASLAIATGLLLTGTDSQRYTLILQQSMQARNRATACVEEALQQMHDDTAYTGTVNLILPQGTCSYTVTNTGGNNRTITANSTVGTVIRKLQISATIGASSISITSWQEVS